MLLELIGIGLDPSILELLLDNDTFRIYKNKLANFNI